MERATAGALKDIMITTCSATYGVRKLLYLPLFLVNGTVTACTTRGCKTQGFGELGCKMHTSVLKVDLCSTVTTTFTLCFCRSLAEVFLPGPSSFLLDYICVCLFSSALFCVTLNKLVVCQDALRKAGRRVMPLVKNFIRLTYEDLATFPLLGTCNCMKLICARTVA